MISQLANAYAERLKGAVLLIAISVAAGLAFMQLGPAFAEHVNPAMALLTFVIGLAQSIISYHRLRAADPVIKIAEPAPDRAESKQQHDIDLRSLLMSAGHSAPENGAHGERRLKREEDKPRRRKAQ